jgi:predicted nucleotidyltransferase
MATMKKEIDQEIVKIFSEHKAELYEKFQVESLAVFGSVSRGSATSDSVLISWLNTRKHPVSASGDSSGSGPRR